MAVRLETTIQRWEGLSTDTKPAGDVRQGSTFHEIDTGQKFIFQVSDWIRDNSGPVSTLDFMGAEAVKRRLMEAQLIKPDQTVDEDGHYNFVEYR